MKAFERGERRRGTGVPEPDEQVRHHADTFPAEEQLHEVVRHHQHEHREGEQRNVTEETLIAVVVGHVADGVDVHQERHERHHGHHQGGKAVDQEADLDVQSVAQQPGVDGPIERGHALEHQLIQHIDRQSAGKRHARNGDAVRTDSADLASEQARRQSRRQRRERDREVNRLHGPFDPRTLKLPVSPVASRDLRRRCCAARGTPRPVSRARSRPPRRPRSV